MYSSHSGGQVALGVVGGIVVKMLAVVSSFSGLNPLVAGGSVVAGVWEVIISLVVGGSGELGVADAVACSVFTITGDRQLRIGPFFTSYSLHVVICTVQFLGTVENNSHVYS